MLLGKKYTRIKRNFNESYLKVGFTDKQTGEKIILPRKLNMLAVVSMYAKVNHKAVIREAEKFKQIREQQKNL